MLFMRVTLFENNVLHVNMYLFGVIWYISSLHNYISSKYSLDQENLLFRSRELA